MSDTFARPILSAAPDLLAHKTDVVELFAESSFRERLTLDVDRRGRDKEWYAHEERKGVGLRRICGEHVRFRAVDSLDPADLADSAREIAGGRHTPVRVEDPCGALDLPPDAPDAVSLEEKRSLLQTAADAAFSLESELDELRLEWQGSTRRIVVAATDARPALTSGSLVALRVFARMADRSAYAVGGGPGGAGRFLTERPESVAQACIERLKAVAASDAGVRTRSELPVILEAGWGGVWLHEAVGHLLEADTEGPYRARDIGTKIAGEAITIIDDGTLSDGRGSSVYDDEGTPTSETILVDRGALRALLTDRVEAARRSLPRTGNGRRQDYRHQPQPRMTNLILCAGKCSREDLVSHVRRGIYVGMIGEGMIRPSDDVFSFDVLQGYLIENGRTTTPLTGLRVSGRASRALESVRAVANDLRIDSGRGMCKKAGQVVPVAVGTPSVLIDPMTVEPSHT